MHDFHVEDIKDIGEISSMQTFFDLSEVDSDLKWMILKGSVHERTYAEQYPENSITSTCSNLAYDGYSGPDYVNWVANG